ncbi:pyridoxamine 5'-phosphate oxidase family protein [Candidatus Borrarchaeum sp.]|uniref:pyridoxamine 5'-phosphate oxidase family protein n=1 Tax=Candidatus Borrarchaeum sp. TaxID=2846742 RepID=UPI00257F55AB|nr:pyridoxamine 5'-phosphate oxidase family protein [Candidatus Borrarchaeum sp.]
MVNLPKEVKDLLVPGAGAGIVKAIGTADSEGSPHTIITGSLMAIDDETLAFGVVAAKTTVNNLKTTNKASIAIYKPPMTGYRIESTYNSFQDSGSLFDSFSEALKKRNLPCSGVILLKVDGVYALGSPEPGKKIA